MTRRDIANGLYGIGAASAAMIVAGGFVSMALRIGSALIVRVTQ